MMKIYLLIIICSIQLFSQDMRQNSFSSLFSDQKANRIGDAVTILVIESSQASNNAETKTERTSSLGLSESGGIGKSSLPGVNVRLGTENGFNGMGSTRTQGLIKTKISATIDSVLSNGNLVIKGSRKLVINGEEQIIKIQGTVRTADINSDNTILSYNISEAEISFEGNGMINDNQKPGWLTKFFHWIF